MKVSKPAIWTGAVVALSVVAATVSSPALAAVGSVLEAPKTTDQITSSDLRERLEELAGTQSKAEVMALYDSGAPAEFLVDTSGAEWQIVAGIPKTAPTHPLLR